MLTKAISKIRPILDDARQSLPVELAGFAEKVYGDIEKLNHFLNKEMDDLEKKQDLANSAKCDARRMLFEQAGRKLEVLKDKRNHSSKIEALEKKLPEAPVEEDPVLKYLREKEIRDRLVGMTERQILSHFGDSLFDGSNPLLVDAILNAPSGFELLGEEDLKKLRSVSAKKKAPKSAAEIELYKELNSLISKMFSLVKKELDTLRKKELSANLFEKNHKE